MLDPYREGGGRWRMSADLPFFVILTEVRIHQRRARRPDVAALKSPMVKPHALR